MRIRSGVAGAAVAAAVWVATPPGTAPAVADAAGEAGVAAVPELFGTTWVAQAVVDGDEVTVDGARQGRASVRLDPKGEISGTLGCGVFTGPVTVAEDSLSAGPLDVTDQAVMFCLLPDSVLGRPLLRVLEGKTRYVLQEGLLYLSRPGGPVVVLRAASA
jgi:heat shock protein HslJ